MMGSRLHDGIAAWRVGVEDRRVTYLWVVMDGIRRVARRGRRLHVGGELAVSRGRVVRRRVRVVPIGARLPAVLVGRSLPVTSPVVGDLGARTTRVNVGPVTVDPFIEVQDDAVVLNVFGGRGRLVRQGVTTRGTDQGGRSVLALSASPAKGATAGDLC
jgi:hypothetical protein